MLQKLHKTSLTLLFILLVSAAAVMSSSYHIVAFAQGNQQQQQQQQQPKVNNIINSKYLTIRDQNYKNQESGGLITGTIVNNSTQQISLIYIYVRYII
jgi:sensor domain CHASE-containing protein